MTGTTMVTRVVWSHRLQVNQLSQAPLTMNPLVGQKFACVFMPIQQGLNLPKLHLLYFALIRPINVI